MRSQARATRLPLVRYPPRLAMPISGEPSFQAAAIADTSNVSTGAPLALSEHASDESGHSVTDTGINVGVLPDSFSNLDGAAQAVADGALPPISDIQTLNELSSGGTDEVQIVHRCRPRRQHGLLSRRQWRTKFRFGHPRCECRKCARCGIQCARQSPAPITGSLCVDQITSRSRPLV